MRGICRPYDHTGRRAFLKGVVAGVGGCAAANWGGLFNSQTIAAEAAKQGKKCILLWMAGGASQFETFDMKPGRPNSGPFRPIATNLPGYHCSEYLPTIAGMIDKLAIIRSMRTSNVGHAGGTHLMHTAFNQEAGVRHPEFGAVVAKYLGDPTAPLPSFIQMSGGGESHPSWGAGFLGPMYDPFRVGSAGKLPTFVNPRLAADRETRRRELLRFASQQFGQDRSAEPFQAYVNAWEKAWQLMEAKGPFDVETEWDKHRDLYGDSDFGKNCLLACQLVESGVPFVEITQSNYDSHSDNAEWHKALLPPLDKGWSGLLVDLERRGMLDDTLVVWMGEIGRTPGINSRAGRDHYVRTWSTALAGGGVQGGVVYGKTDEDGVDVAENPVTEGDFFATVYTALGISPLTTHYVGVRPIYITPPESTVVDDLLA